MVAAAKIIGLLVFILLAILVRGMLGLRFVCGAGPLYFLSVWALD